MSLLVQGLAGGIELPSCETRELAVLDVDQMHRVEATAVSNRRNELRCGCTDRAVAAQAFAKTDVMDGGHTTASEATAQVQVQGCNDPIYADMKE